jgi:hypothetical protein
MRIGKKLKDDDEEVSCGKLKDEEVSSKVERIVGKKRRGGKLSNLKKR